MDVTQIVHNPATGEQVMANLLQIAGNIQGKSPVVYLVSSKGSMKDKVMATSDALAKLCGALSNLLEDVRFFLVNADKDLAAADAQAGALMAANAAASASSGAGGGAQ
jgi:hypothetical protein